MKQFVLILSLAIITSSCITIEFVNDNYYTYLSTKQQSKIKKLVDFDSTKAGNIYEITGPQLLTELDQNKKSLVYVFKSGCKSDACYPLSQIRDYADENNLKLYLVMTSYHSLDNSLNQKVGVPLYSINAEAYGETKSRKYLKQFEKEIGCDQYLELMNEKWMGSYYFFEKDQITEMKKYLFGEEFGSEEL